MDHRVKPGDDVYFLDARSLFSRHPQFIFATPAVYPLDARSGQLQ